MQPERLGKYEIVAKIGQGGMGEVYRAHDPILGRDVAIKTMAAGSGLDDDQRKRFHREAQSAARLNHPNIITVHDFGEEQGRMYIAMELLEGSDLKAAISEQRPPGQDAKLNLIEQICEGLAFAHSKGVIHRDLKPGNIHLGRHDHVKIMDFGLARISTSEMTQAGMMLGTPHYMSPEQVRGERVTSGSDVFALGVVCYELFSGRKPFNSESLTGLLYQVMQSVPTPLEQVSPEAPSGLCAVIRKAMAKDPAERYADASDMREALRGVRAALVPATRTPGAGPPVLAGSNLEATIATPMPAATLEGPGTAPTQGPHRSREATARSPRVADPGATQIQPMLAATQVGARPHGRPAQRAGSSAPLWIAGAVAALGAAGAAGFALFSYRSGTATHPSVQGVHASAPPPITSVSAVTTPPPPPPWLASLDAARRRVAERDYREAAILAEQVLKDDPGNEAARQVLDQGRRALGEADLLLAQGRRAADVGDIQTASAVLGRLTALDPRHPGIAPLTTRLLGVQAEQTRKAIERAGQQPAGPPPTQIPLATLPPATLPPPTLPVSPATTLPPPPAATVPAQAEAAARQAVRGVLDEYRAGFETRDADALRAVQPGIDYPAMKQVFATVTGYTVRIDVRSISVTGDTATADCVVTYNPVPKPAGKLKPVATIFHLRRSGELWLIERLERR